jgi:hypothetical protein
MSIVESVGAEIPRSWLRPLVYGLSADVQPGDAICMKLHRGALGSAWYEAAACAPAARPAAPLDPNA